MGLVLATTGYEEADLAAIREAAKKIPIFKTANMSLGVNVMLDLVRKAAVALPEFDIEIIEKHHNAKVDAPSGTALLIADAMKEVCLTDKEYVFGRHTKTQRRRREEIGIHAVRGGTVTGEHEVDFGDDEVVTITRFRRVPQDLRAGRAQGRRIPRRPQARPLRYAGRCCWRSPA